MGMDLDLRRLRFFVEVVRQGGFSTAARKLFAAQPTVSKAVKQLEEELGVVLLQRGTTRNELTDEGRVVYNRALQLLAEGAQLRDELGALKGLRSGRLAIGFPRMGTSSLFASKIAAFKLLYPAVDLDLEVQAVPVLLEQLRSGEIEVAALFEGQEDMEFKQVYEDELLMLLPATHALADDPSIRLSELQGMPLFLFENEIPASAMLLDELTKAGVSPTVAARTSQLDLLHELVKTGAGAAFMPSALAVRRHQQATRALPLRDVRVPWRIGFGWMRNAHLSHAARAWLRHTLPGGNP